MDGRADLGEERAVVRLDGAADHVAAAAAVLAVPSRLCDKLLQPGGRIGDQERVGLDGFRYAANEDALAAPIMSAVCLSRAIMSDEGLEVSLISMAQRFVPQSSTRSNS